MEVHNVSHLVKSEDLNHHGTLFAGRMAEWFVEAGFIAAADAIGNPENVVCVKIHGLHFKKPATKGDIIKIESRIAHAGRTSITVNARVTRKGTPEPMVDGFLTFVCVDESGKSMPHGIVLPEPANEEERKIREMAASLK